MTDYLYLLQTARESWASFLTPLLYGISEFSYYCIIVIVFILYMCVDKKKYTALLITYSVSNFLMSVIKLTFCVYRPWLRDTRLHPDNLAKATATGYSFPSGHTTGATVFYSFFAYNEYRGRKRAGVIFVLILLTILTAFSRNWLGAHTLADVLTAIILGIGSIALIEYSLYLVDHKPNGDIVFTVACSIASIASMIYFYTKSYPMDLGADGQIICDPLKMQMDGWQSAGLAMGVTICWLIDRRFIHFTTDVSTKRKVVRGVIALILFLLLYMVLLKKLEHFSPLFGSFLRSFISMLICAGLYPAIFTTYEKKHLEM